jgi:hypothetical protein
MVIASLADSCLTAGAARVFRKPFPPRSPAAKGVDISSEMRLAAMRKINLGSPMHVWIFANKARSAIAGFAAALAMSAML